MIPRLITASPQAWVEQTDIGAYAQRQAQSCTYLEVLFVDILRRVNEPARDLTALFGYLTQVHRRQYRDLAQCITLPDAPARSSFYFDTLYAAFHLTPAALPTPLAKSDLMTILAIQGVSYVRGHDRYRLLQAYAATVNQPFVPVWQRFYQDAHKNAERVCAFLDAHFAEESVAQTLDAVLRAEEQVMRTIWARQQIDDSRFIDQGGPALW